MIAEAVRAVECFMPTEGWTKPRAGSSPEMACSWWMNTAGSLLPCPTSR